MRNQNDGGVRSALMQWFDDWIKRQKIYTNAKSFWNISLLVAIAFAIGLAFSFYNYVAGVGVTLGGVLAFLAMLSIPIYLVYWWIYLMRRTHGFADLGVIPSRHYLLICVPVLALIPLVLFVVLVFNFLIPIFPAFDAAKRGWREGIGR